MLKCKINLKSIVWPVSVKALGAEDGGFESRQGVHMIIRDNIPMLWSQIVQIVKNIVKILLVWSVSPQLEQMIVGSNPANLYIAQLCLL
jgi:hypothetical protein